MEPSRLSRGRLSLYQDGETRPLQPAASRPPLRIAYIPGPGDVLGTFKFWRRGRSDPRVPVVAYSAMFYDACETLGAEALVIQRGAGEPVRDGSYEFRFVRHAPSRGAASYWASLARFSAGAVREMRRFRPDIVILGGDFFWPFAPLLKANGARLILSIHNMFEPIGGARANWRKRLLRGAHARMLRACVDGAIGVSEACRRQFVERAGTRAPTRVCRIQCRREDLERIERRLSVRRETRVPLIVFVGRIERDKGVFDLLAAFEAVARDHAQARLVFAGDGGAREDLLARIDASAFRERISAPGRLDGAGVHALLDAATFLVCPTQRSFLEGFPAVCIEALAHGVPIVVSSAVPSRDALGAAAIAYEADDPEALAGVLGDLLARPEKLELMRAAAKRRRRDLYDESRAWGAQLLDLISEVAGGARSPRSRERAVARAI